jgi:hypothetical protein
MRAEGAWIFNQQSKINNQHAGEVRADSAGKLSVNSRLNENRVGEWICANTL